jgi:hypothetical protein
MELFYELNSVVKTKKAHPCGSDEWKVVRMGADIKIECLKCSRVVMLGRSKFEKSVKKVLSQPPQ